MLAQKYDFELSVDDTPVSRHSIYLRDLKSAWPHVALMASGAQRGSKIRVLDKDGRIVILTGVAAARLLSRNTMAA